MGLSEEGKNLIIFIIINNNFNLFIFFFCLLFMFVFFRWFYYYVKFMVNKFGDKDKYIVIFYSCLEFLLCYLIIKIEVFKVNFG